MFQAQFLKTTGSVALLGITLLAAACSGPDPMITTTTTQRTDTVTPATAVSPPMAVTTTTTSHTEAPAAQ
jgi:hypothetical protein